MFLNWWRERPWKSDEWHDKTEYIIVSQYGDVVDIKCFTGRWYADGDDVLFEVILDGEAQQFWSYSNIKGVNKCT